MSIEEIRALLAPPKKLPPIAQPTLQVTTIKEKKADEVTEETSSDERTEANKRNDEKQKKILLDEEKEVKEKDDDDDDDDDDDEQSRKGDATVPEEETRQGICETTNSSHDDISDTRKELKTPSLAVAPAIMYSQQNSQQNPQERGNDPPKQHQAPVYDEETDGNTTGNVDY